MQAVVALEYRTGEHTRASGASEITRIALLLERHKNLYGTRPETPRRTYDYADRTPRNLAIHHRNQP